VNGDHDNVSIDYGADDLSAIAELFGAPSFPGVEGSGEAALRSARRSLLARGVLEIDDEAMLRVLPPHSILFRIALAPAAVVNAELRRGDSVETRSYYALPSVAVEHSVAIGRVHRLEQFGAEHLLKRVRNFVALGERPAADGNGLELTVSELNQALADRRLPEGGPFATALEKLESTSYVRCLHRHGGTLVGGELRWIDTGDSGLWLVEPSEADAERVTVRPAQARELLDELLSYLPGGDRQPAAT
jgi:hypothetical protein